MYIHMTCRQLSKTARTNTNAMCIVLHSAKGGAVETGCSGLHYIMRCFTI